MADNTIYGTRGWLSVDQGGPLLHESEKMNAVGDNTETACKVGQFVTHVDETLPDVAPAITTDGRPVGYLARPADMGAVLNADPDWYIDTALPDNTDLELYKLGSGKIVPCFLEAAAGPIAVVKGDLIAVGTEAGKVRKFAYTDATAATDSLLEVVGHAAESSAGHATDDLILLVRLDV